MKHFSLNVALLFLFGLLALVLRYTKGKGFGAISGEDERRVVHWARLLVLLAFVTAFVISSSFSITANEAPRSPGKHRNIAGIHLSFLVSFCSKNQLDFGHGIISGGFNVQRIYSDH